MKTNAILRLLWQIGVFAKTDAAKSTKYNQTCVDASDLEEHTITAVRCRCIELLAIAHSKLDQEYAVCNGQAAIKYEGEKLKRLPQ